MKNFFCVIIHAISMSVFGSELKIVSSNYQDAVRSDNFIKFVGESTKLGFITSSFDGFVKNMPIHYEIDQDILKNISIVIDVKSLDTNNDSRNKKMHNLCLNVDKYPTIEATLLSPINLNSEREGNTNISLKMMNKDIKTPLKYKIIKNNDIYIISFQGRFSFKEAGIIDPSISIAKVHEFFDLIGSIKIK